MKNLRRSINWKKLSQILGIILGVVAIYLSLKNIHGDELKKSLASMDTLWIAPIIIINFGVIALKALRWQIMIRPVKKINFLLMFRVLTIGFMANNVLPARLGEAVRIHMLGKDASLNRLTTTATLVADRIVEGLSFLILAALLVVATNVPKWMNSGLIITITVTIVVYIATAIYSKRNLKNRFLKRFQDGVHAIMHLKLTSLALAASILSWLTQGILIYMTQLAFGVHLPIWGVLLVLISINLAVMLPSAPGYIGTFEFACILAYSYLGIDKSLGLLIGATFHLLQIIPVTLVGGVMLLRYQLGTRKTLLPDDLNAYH